MVGARPGCQLIAVIGDATSRFYARFTEHDTTEENWRIELPSGNFRISVGHGFT
jgi:hypothetical protein